jgi:hypothetical protein
MYIVSVQDVLRIKINIIIRKIEYINHLLGFSVVDVSATGSFEQISIK